MRVLEHLDPLSQSGDLLIGGAVRLPGRIPVAPISLAALTANSIAMAAAMLFAVDARPAYTVPFAIAHAVILGHLWTYHVAYHTRRRFLAFRQVFLLAALVAFLDWMILDLGTRPELASDALASSRLSITFWANISTSALIFLHWLVLGRGYRTRQPRPPIREDAADTTPPDAASPEATPRV